MQFAPQSTNVLQIQGLESETADYLKRCVEQAAALLPSQGPITAFVFLNTLQALENIPFDEGVQNGAKLFGCEPYLREDIYREKLAQDRIRLDDLALALRRDLKDQTETVVAKLVTRHQLRLAMLQYPLRTGPTQELQWFVAETDALKRMRPDTPSTFRERFLIDTKHWVMRDLRSNLSSASLHESKPQPLPIEELIERFGRSSIERWSPETWETFSLQALWRICRNGIFNVPPVEESHPLPIRHRDVLFEAAEFDSDGLVNPVLIRFCSAYADQGFANWSLPDRDQGIFKAFLTLYGQDNGPPDAWMAFLSNEIQRIKTAEFSPLESLHESLHLLGVDRSDWHDFITSSLLALRGWAGLIWQLEVRPDRQALAAPPGTLIEFLAVRLILERLAISYLALEYLNFQGPLHELRTVLGSKLPKSTHSSVEQRAFLIFQLAQVLGWSPSILNHLETDDWAELIDEIESFSSMERRRIFHQAFERHLRAQTLDALSVHCAQKPQQVASPRFQSVYCIDTREESFRRHLEEICPEAETFGAAGFYSVPMYFKGVADAHFAALCPIVIRPQHWVTEEVDTALMSAHLR